MPQFFWLIVSIIIISSVKASAQVVVAPEEVQNIFRKIQNLYSPVVKSAGGEFHLLVYWDRNTVGGSAHRDDWKKYVVGVDRGLLLAPRLTSDSLKMLICHEMGHLFGGQPLRPAPVGWEGPLDESGLSLLSAEGQADYYASSVCFRRLVGGEDHRESLKGRQIPQRLLQQCGAAWGDQTPASFLCLRTAVAGLDFLNLVKEFPISLSDRDETVVEKTLIGEYPSRQCRLDTLKAGALCRAKAPLDFVRKDKSAEGCARGPGARPACWHKASN